MRPAPAQPLSNQPTESSGLPSQEMHNSLTNTNRIFYASISHLLDDVMYPVSIHDPAFNPLPLSLLPTDRTIVPTIDNINIFAVAAEHPLCQYRSYPVTEPTTKVDFRHQLTQSFDMVPDLQPSTLENGISNLILAPISIKTTNGAFLHIHGIVDTAAQLPVLSTNFCRTNSIEIFPISNANLRTTFFDGRIQLSRWRTASLTVRFMPDIITESEFLVLDNSSGPDCLIGGQLRQRLGLDNHFSSIPTTWMDDNVTSAMLSPLVAESIHRIGVIPSSPPRSHVSKPLVTGAYPDDDFIYQHWSDVPTSTPFDLPLSYSGVAPTRQHVVDHVNSEQDAAEIALRLPKIIAALNENNTVTEAPSFISDPEATVHLSHVAGTVPKYIPQPRNMPERKRVAVRLQIQKWQRTGKIRYLRPDERHIWNSQLLTAPKPGSFEEDGTQKLRICFNGKSSVNIGLKCDSYTLPSISAVLNKCKGASFFTELDCEDAYLQLILDAESQPITAFEFEGKSYCFVGAPYGITFIGNTFQRIMQKVFQDLPFVQVYIDNIWIISEDDYDTHYNHVMAVIARCNEFHIRLNLKKPVLFKREFVGFGHHISSQGVSLDPKKTEAALSWDPESLQTCAQLGSFLGATNYLRENIRHYTELTHSLSVAANHHKTPKARITWTPELIASFKLFQHAIAHAPLIHYADHSRQFALACDASRVATGCCLFQPTKPGEQPNAENIVSFYSRSLLDSEKGYAAYKLELLSIVQSIRHYHDFLWGTHFLLYTDHQSLTHIWKQSTFNNTYAGWILELADHSFDIFHIAGVLNIFPDVLSRLYRNKTWGLSENTELAEAVPRPGVLGIQPLLAKIYTFQAEIIPDLLSPSSTSTALPATLAPSVIPICDSSVAAAAATQTRDYPPATTEQLKHIDKVHSIGHYGVQAILYRLRAMHIKWPFMLQHIQEIVASCIPCQQWSIVKRGYQPLRSPHAWWPFDIVQFDLSTSLPMSSSGNTVLLVLIDILTSLCLLRPLKDKESATIAFALMQIFGDFGTPRVIHSDNEPTLVSEVMRKFYDYLGTVFQTSIPFNSHSLGKAERAVGCSLTCIHKLLSACGGEWDRMAPFAQLSMNTKIKELSGSDPFVLMFNRTCHIFDFDSWSKDTALSPNVKTIESLAQWKEHQSKLESIVFPAVRKRITQKQAKANAAYAASHTTPSRSEIPVGTIVAIKDVNRASKNEPAMLSPYTIHSRAQNGGYIVRDMAGGLLGRAVPTEHIRPLYHARRLDTSNIAYLDYVYDRRVNPTNHRDEYLVKWTGAPLTESTWVDVANIQDYSAITQYLASLERIPKTRKQKRSTVIKAITASASNAPTSSLAQTASETPTLVVVKPRTARKSATQYDPAHAATAAIAPALNVSSRGRVSKRRG